MKPLFNKPRVNFICHEKINPSSSDPRYTEYIEISCWLPNRFLNFRKSLFFVYNGEKREHYFKSKQYEKEHFEREFKRLLTSNMS
jgi:hypothetical protein